MQIQRRVNFEPLQGTITEAEKKQNSDAQIRKRDVFESSKDSDSSSLRNLFDDALEQSSDSASEQAYKLQQIANDLQNATQAQSAAHQKYFESMMTLIRSHNG